jgi:hypothetical protein
MGHLSDTLPAMEVPRKRTPKKVSKTVGDLPLKPVLTDKQISSIKDQLSEENFALIQGMIGNADWKDKYDGLLTRYESLERRESRTQDKYDVKMLRNKHLEGANEALRSDLNDLKNPAPTPNPCDTCSITQQLEFARSTNQCDQAEIRVLNQSIVDIKEVVRSMNPSPQVS